MQIYHFFLPGTGKKYTSNDEKLEVERGGSLSFKSLLQVPSLRTN